MLAVAESFWEVAFAFPAVVGLPEQIAERDAATLQKLLDARGEDRASSGAAFFGESPEPQPAAHFARGYWMTGKRNCCACGP